MKYMYPSNCMHALLHRNTTIICRIQIERVQN